MRSFQSSGLPTEQVNAIWKLRFAYQQYELLTKLWDKCFFGNEIYVRTGSPKLSNNAKETASKSLMRGN